MSLELVDDSDWSRVLALVAHPDDLEYGAASAVARWTSRGVDVTYVLATRGEAGLAIPPAEAGPVREQEQRRSAAVVGVDDVTFLDHRDGVVEYGLRLRRDMAVAVRRHRPQAVVTLNHRDSWGGPSFNMADHRNVGLAVLDGVRDAANPWIFPDLADQGLEAWDGVDVVLVAASSLANHAVDVTGFLDRGIKSLEQHRSYLDHTGTDAGAMLRSSAEEAGREAGCQHAVAFEVIRP